MPTAVFLCGTSLVTALGLAAARHLASHGVKTQVFLPDAAKYPLQVRTIIIIVTIIIIITS